jgi:hypothetical protein
MFDLMQYALIFYDFQLILAQMGRAVASSRVHIPADIDGRPRGVAKNFLILLQITPATPAENHCTL